MNGMSPVESPRFVGDVPRALMRFAPGSLRRSDASAS